MKHIALTDPIISDSSLKLSYFKYLLVFFAGLLGTLGFAPFNLPGLTILGLAVLFSEILKTTHKQAFILGLTYGLAYFGFGVSWVIVSIHDYGQLNYVLAGLITLVFIAYLSLFPALTGYLFKILNCENSTIRSMSLFSVLWCLSEFLRAHLMSGFPWLIIGVSQINTPLKYLAPVVGIYGLSFLCVFSATLLPFIIREYSTKRYVYLASFILIMISPAALGNLHWTSVQKTPVTIGAIQANLSMRDKWDETMFWNLLKYYKKATNSLLGKDLIILPESAIPLPASYLQNYLNNLNEKALKAKSALMLGILQPTDDTETTYYNSIITLGQAQGQHIKHQLVPFGEYIPKPFVAINHKLNLPEPNIVPGKVLQKLITIQNHPIASLICYEIAYPSLLRLQMPEAEWIISISDNGWFGRSLASYQQLQISQMLSLLTGRYQIVVNNDGLSSVINTMGEVVEGLPSFSSGILQGEIFPATGTTPWILWNEYPILIFCAIFLFYILLSRFRLYLKQ